MKLIATVDTFLKTLPVETEKLKANSLPDQLIPIKKGTTLDIAEHFLYEGDSSTTADNHFLIQLTQPVGETSNLRWFVEATSAKAEGLASQDTPAPKPPQPAKKTDFGPTIRLPGINRPVGIYEPVYHEPKASNFTWSELTKGGARIPVSADITQRIVKLCKYMDGVREFLGNKSIVVTSGYRDPVSNREQGGVADSRHLKGDAIDFYVEGMDIVETFYKLKSYHPTGGLAVGNGFVHIDLRPSDRPVRWLYKDGPNVELF